MRKVIKIIIPLVLIAGIVYALDWFAVIDVNGMARKIPVVGKLIPESKSAVKPASKTASQAQENPLEKENKQLKEQVGKLNNEVKKLNENNNSLKNKQEEYKNIIKNLEDAKKENAANAAGYKELAAYYADMKPAAAVQIMDNLDDDTVIGILLNLEDEQAGKILAAMDPKRAAQIVRKMT